jgi:peroxiredoxin
MLTVGDRLPEFDLEAVVSTDKGREFARLTNRSHPGKWVVLFSWPMDFTFVCPTEIAEFGKRHSEFEDRDAQLLGMSTDTHFVHLAWRRDHADLKTLPYRSDLGGVPAGRLAVPRGRSAAYLPRRHRVLGYPRHPQLSNPTEDTSPWLIPRSG